MTNPWSEAAGSPKNTVSTPLTAHQRHTQEEISCFLSTLQSLVRVWHVLDGLVGLILTLYGCILIPTHLIFPIFLTLGMGILLLVRSFAGLSGLNSDALDRFGLRLSSVYLSPFLAFEYLILSFLCMGNHAILVDYIQNHASQLHFSTQVVSFVETHHHALWVVLLVSAIMELIRWWTVPILQAWLLQLDTSLGSPDIELLYTPNRKPWWWQQQRQQRLSRREDENGLHDALLEQPHWAQQHNHSRNYSIHDGISQHDTSFWSRWFGSSPRDNDDESVDFASVQEEWASKSQEDPFWWSREEDTQRQGNQKDGNKDTSWAGDEESGLGRPKEEER